MFGFNLPQCIAGLTLLTSGSLVGLLAIWVALGRPHWFLRVMAWAAVVLPLLLIPAFEPVLLFSIQTLVAVVLLAVARGWLASRRGTTTDGEPGTRPSGGWRPQFHLRDLLLLTVLVAVATAVGVAAPGDMWKLWDTLRGGLFFDFMALINSGPMTPGEGWAIFGVLGLGMGISTVAAAWGGLSRRPWWLRLGGLLLVPTSALMAAWLVLLRAVGWLPGSRGGSGRSFGRHFARVVLGLLTLAILAPPVATFLLLVSPAPELPQIVLPNPNGYDDLCRAGKALASVTVPESDTATGDQFVAFRDAYDDVVDSARSALNRPCIVPLQYTVADIEIFDRAANMRQLYRAFRAEGELARMDGRAGDAAAYYLDEFRLARAVSRDGMAIDWLVGLAVEGCGIEGMIGLREDLDAEQCRNVIGALQRIDADRESPDDVADRDALWECVAFGNAGWVNRWLWMIGSLESDSRPLYRDLDNRNQAQRRMLVCALALQAYRLDHGELPTALADLVPEYLPEVPVDPFSGKPLVYRPKDERYALYSVGPDGRDNGGNAGQSWGNGLTPGTDLLVDPPAAAPVAEES